MLAAVRAIGLVALVACKRSDATEPVKPEADKVAIGIVLPASQGLPKLELRAAFLASVESKPHVEPLANAFVAVRKTCFASAAPALVSLHVDIVGGRIHATKLDDAAACTVRALNGQPIADTDVSVDLQVSVADR
jgi:hypothetical protein